MGLSSLARVTFTLPVALTGTELGVVVQDLAVRDHDMVMVLDHNHNTRKDCDGIVIGLNSSDINRRMRLLAGDGTDLWIDPSERYLAATVIHHPWNEIGQFDDQVSGRVDPDAIFHAVLDWAVLFRQLAMAKVS